VKGPASVNLFVKASCFYNWKMWFDNRSLSICHSIIC